MEKQYEVTITETSQRSIWVKAESASEAQVRIEADYKQGRIMLDDDDYVSTTFQTRVIEEITYTYIVLAESDSGRRLEREFTAQNRYDALIAAKVDFAQECNCLPGSIHVRRIDEVR